MSSMRMTQCCAGDRPQSISGSMQRLPTGTTWPAVVSALGPFKIERADLASRESGEKQKSPLLDVVKSVEKS